MYVANVGDSRLYVIGETMKQITKDHSYVEEMIRMGKVDREDARMHEKKNVITRAVGVMDKVRADFFEVDLDEHDTVLLCTDGLSNMVTDERILEIVLSSTQSEDVARKLIDEANKNGGQDNITAVVLKPYYDEVK
jgi:protein phosphatase